MGFFFFRFEKGKEKKLKKKMGSESKNGGGGGVGLSSEKYSPATKKMIQSLKEIVNCPDSEIYAALKECNMDPDDAVNRLLSQDTFHEVKSKRERRKEMKETQELRPRVNYSGSSRGTGNRSASERYSGWRGSIQTGYEEMSNTAHKGENAWVTPLQSYLTADVKGEIASHQASSNSDSSSMDSRGQSIGTGGAISAAVQPSSGCQSAWLLASAGHLSMADVVRLGRHSSKSSQISPEASYTHPDAVTGNSYDHYPKPPCQVSAPIQAESHHDLHPQNASNLSRTIYKLDVSGGQKAFLDGWPVIEHPSAATSSNLDESVGPDADIYSNQSNYYSNGSKLSRNCLSDSVQSSDWNVTDENITTDHIVPASASSGQKSVTNDSVASQCDDSEPGSGSNLSDPNYAAPLTDKVIAVPSAAAKLQHLSLGEEEQESNCAVVLPSHLQALAADCSHLSFGTYKSGNSSPSTVPFSSNQSKEDRQEAPGMLDGLSAGPLETRKVGYDANESLGSLCGAHKTMVDSTNYDLNASFQSELTKQDFPEATPGSEFNKPSLHDSNVENIKKSTPELSFARTDPIFRNVPVHNEMTYLDSKSSDSLLSNIQSLRDTDSLRAQLLMKQSIPSRHVNAVSSMNSSSISFPEDRKPPPGTFSLSAASSVLPQHRIANSHPTFPLEQPSNNMISYSGLPQSYSHLPSAFQQSYPGSDKVSAADLKYNVPQYGSSMNRFPGASPTTGYGSYGMSGNVPGSFLHDSPPMIHNSGYDDLFHRQYKEVDHFNPLQQNSSSSTWNHGPSLRKLPSAQEIAYYNLLGQNVQYSGYRQDQQQPSQYYGGLGYSDFYRLQTREHQQQNLGSSSSGGTQDLLSQQLHQLWRQH